jgi:hypothetical protein
MPGGAEQREGQLQGEEAPQDPFPGHGSFGSVVFYLDETGISPALRTLTKKP